MSGSTVTVCDMVRDALAAAPACGCPNPNKPQCKGVSGPPPECSVFKLATHRDIEFDWQYDPASLFSSSERTTRQKKLADIEGDIKADEATLEGKYGTSAPVGDVSWWRMQRCLINTDGKPGGNFGHKYVGRQDMQAAGYAPYPLVGGSTLETQAPVALTNAVPVLMDRGLNADLMVIVIFVLLVIIFAVLMYKAYKWSQDEPARKAAAKAAERTKREASDPFKGTSFESWPTDPNEKWRALIPVYEAQGYDMCAYRKRLGMPLKGHCPDG